MKGYDAWLTNDRAGDHDNECGAWSYEDTFQCNKSCDHAYDHLHITDNGLHITWPQREDDFDEDGMPTVRP